MPLGQGYTIEEQLLGSKSKRGGIQLDVFNRVNKAVEFTLLKVARKGRVGLELDLELESTPASLGLEAGTTISMNPLRWVGLFCMAFELEMGVLSLTRDGCSLTFILRDQAGASSDTTTLDGAHGLGDANDSTQGLPIAHSSRDDTLRSW